jgi:hypothetical protein
MIKVSGRLFRGALALLNMIILDQGMISGGWAIALAAISTYLMFTAVSGQCLVREYLLRPSTLRNDTQNQ